MQYVQKSYFKSVPLAVPIAAFMMIASPLFFSGPSSLFAYANAQDAEVLIPRNTQSQSSIRGTTQDENIRPPQLDGAPDRLENQSIGNNAVEAASRLRDIVQRIDPNAELLANGANFKVQNIPVTLVYDINADRMRLVSPAASFNDLDTEQLVRIMQANFDSALDARYALAQGTLWATFIHPLSSITSDEFGSGLGQTINLIATFGSTYSSGAIIFGGGDSTEQQQELIEDLQEQSKEI